MRYEWCRYIRQILDKIRTGLHGIAEKPRPLPMSIEPLPSVEAKVKPTEADSLPDLVVHVLNAGWGDSVIIQFPDGRWGVVDCNCRNQDADHNATVKFLAEHGAKHLEFVC